MFIGILIIIFCCIMAYRHYNKPKVKDSAKIAEAISRLPSVTYVPKEMSTAGQLLNLASNKNVLTYFKHENGIVTMRFKNGVEFCKHLKDCVFQLDCTKYGQRVVYEKGQDAFVLKEVDFIGLKRKDWNTIFNILKSAGTIYGSLSGF